MFCMELSSYANVLEDRPVDKPHLLALGQLLAPAEVAAAAGPCKAGGMFTLVLCSST